MDTATRGTLRLIAAQLVFAIALIHLVRGVVNWVQYGPARGRLLVLSGLALMAGVLVASRVERLGPFYVAGILAMLGYVVADFGWHLAGHPRGLFGAPRSRGESLSVEWFLDHLLASEVQFISIAIAVTAALVLTVLLLDDTDR